MQPPPFMLALALLSGTLSAAGANNTNTAPVRGTNIFVIGLPTALQLSGARNLDVQIAREKLAEARANNESAVWQFFPTLIPGAGYRRHDNLIQDVAGNIVEVHKDSYTVGPTLAAQLDLGDAIYKKLAARQLVTAAESAYESQRQESALVAVRGYFDLAKAQAAVRVATESMRIAEDFAAQVKLAVGAGIAFKGDALRAEVRADKNRLALRQAQEQVAMAAAQLVRTLHLDAKVELVAPGDELVPLTLVSPDAALDSLLAQALAARPEVRQNRSWIEAARKSRDGARYGPLVPSLGAQVFAGGLGGGIDGGPSRFGQSAGYQFTLGWRIGPGGLFDHGRIRAGDARLQVARLTDAKLIDEINRQVIESQTRLRSLSDQLGTARHAVQAADEALKLASQRREFAVGVVLEQVQAEQDFTRARLDYLNVVAEFNKTQFELKRAIGDAPEAKVAKQEGTVR